VSGREGWTEGEKETENEKETDTEREMIGIPANIKALTARAAVGAGDARRAGRSACQRGDGKRAGPVTWSIRKFYKRQNHCCIHYTDIL
jgi:hypothetical protein